MSGNSMKRMWIDTDAGVDDAQAILMALSYEIDIEVIGISTVHGNASAHQVALNVLRLLKAADRLDVPVYEGCSTSLLGTLGDSSSYHGQDGFGDVPDPDPPSKNLIKQEKAVYAMINAAKEFKGELTLVALGPLTNIAIASRLDPDFGRNLSSCYIMGGNYEGKGNITACAEFNFHTDPESTFVVLESLGAPIRLAGWELCLKHSLPWACHDKLREGRNTKTEFLKNIEARTRQNCLQWGWEKWIPCDEIAMAIAINSNVIKESKQCHVSIEIAGKLTRGQMVVDWENRTNKPFNVEVVTKLNMEAYMTCLKNVVK